jgi:hypothetical protein
MTLPDDTDPSAEALPTAEAMAAIVAVAQAWFRRDPGRAVSPQKAAAELWVDVAREFDRFRAASVRGAYITRCREDRRYFAAYIGAKELERDTNPTVLLKYLRGAPHD